jgi:hypothetical protein
MRWGVLPRARLLRGFAHERLGRVDSAAAEYAAVLVQWSRADPLLAPQLSQAERGLRQLGRTTERLAALGYKVAGRRQPPANAGPRRYIFPWVERGGRGRLQALEESPSSTG